LGEESIEWPETPQPFHINAFYHGHIKSINSTRQKSCKNTLKICQGRSLEIIILCQIVVFKYAIQDMFPSKTVEKSHFWIVASSTRQGCLRMPLSFFLWF